MAYNKKTWANGDLITKESMNNIENGIYNAHDEIETLKNNTSNIDDNSTATNKTWSSNKINLQLEEKANKNEVFSMANMGQDIKEAMTGGSIAVVGGSCVGFNNLTEELRSGIKKEVVKDYKADGGYVDRAYFSAKNGIGGLPGEHSSDTSNFCRIKLGVVSGQKIKIERHMSGTTYCKYLFLDSNGFVVSYELYEGSTTALVTDELTVPGNAAYICINARRPTGTYVFNVTTETNDTIATKTYVDYMCSNGGIYKDIKFVIESIQDNSYATLDYRTDRCRSEYIPVKKGDIIIDELLDTHITDLFFYDENYTKDYKTNMNGTYTCTKDSYLRIRMKYSDNSTIDNTIMDYLSSQISIKCPTVSSLIKKELYEYNKTIRKNTVKVVNQIQLPSDCYLGSDFIIVNDILYIFNASTDDGTTFSSINKYSIDFNTNNITYLGDIIHNLGHCNSVSYNETYDTLILGNGSGDYTLTGQIILLENFSDFDINSTITKSTDCIVIDCADYNLGEKFNVVWGEDNFGNNDIAYLITTDGHCIRKLQLGRDNNILTYGIQLKTTGFNGTFNIVHESRQGDYGYGTCVQGGEYYNGKVIYGYGHDTGGISIRMATLSDNLIIEDILYKKLNSNGTSSGGTSGITVYNENVVVGFDNKLVFIEVN